MGRALELFELPKAGGYNELKRLVDDAVTEELFLDYKTVSTHPPYSSLDAKDQANLGKAISGFGNWDGGVVVWGVDCRPDNQDAPTFDPPLQDAAAFKACIDGKVGGATIPPVQGVETIVLLEDKDGKAGYVATFVPTALNVPVQSLTAKKQGYYMRAGSSFLPVPHGVLAGMFGKRPMPHLTAHFMVTEVQHITADQSCKISLDLCMRNTGRGIAKDAHFIVEGSESNNVQFSTQFNRDHWEWASLFRPKRGFYVVSNDKFRRVLPDEERQVVRIELSARRWPDGDFALKVLLGTDNSPSSERIDEGLTIPQIMKAKSLSKASVYRALAK